MVRLRDLTRELRPTVEAQPETLTKGSTDILAESALTSEDRHAAYLVGFSDGMHHQAGLDVADTVQAALHERTLAALGMARRSAIHGPAFSEMVTEAGERQ